MTAIVAAEPFTITAPGVYEVPEDIYHADPVPTGSLSVSGAKRLLPPSCPAIFAHERAHGRRDRRAFDFGHAAHTKVLGTGAEMVIVQKTAKDGTRSDADDYKTKSAQDHRDEIRAAGKVPVLAEEALTVDAMAAAILDHPIARSLFNPDYGQPEQSLFWVDEQTGTWLRSRLDWLPNPMNDRMIIADYKTSLTANPAEFERHAVNFGYHMQAPWYVDAALDLELAESAEFVFVVQEKTAPYLVSVIQLDLTAMQIGRSLNRRAIDTYTRCVAEDRWPGYTDDVALVSVPGWYARQHEEN